MRMFLGESRLEDTLRRNNDPARIRLRREGALARLQAGQTAQSRFTTRRNGKQAVLYEKAYAEAQIGILKRKLGVK